MLLDIVVVAYRPGEETRRLLAELPRFTKAPYELHYFDNTGNPKNLSAAWNDLAAAGSAPFIVFLNPDISLSPEWDERLTKFLELHPEVGVVLPDPVGHPPFKSVSGRTCPIAYRFPPSEEDMIALGQWAKTQEGFYAFTENDPAPFFAAMMRRKTFEALFGFDERLRFYGQDHDVQHRLRIRGLQTVRVYSCLLYNQVSVPTKKAIEHGDIDINEEYRHIGRVLPYVKDGSLAAWDRLTPKERGLIRQDPRYVISRPAR